MPTQLKQLDKRGYGQLELNQVAFRRDGRIEAQTPLADGIEYVENGMLLVVNPFDHVVEMPVEGDPTQIGSPFNRGPLALHYSAEHMYDDRANALKDFKLEAGSFLPRLGYLSIGDKYTTNTVCHNYSTDSDLFESIREGNMLYAHPHYSGYQYVSAETTGAIAAAIRVTTMPDGQNAIMFQVIEPITAANPV